MTYTAIEPDDNLLLSSRVLRRLEPEVELLVALRVIGDGHLASIRLANVEVDIGDGGAVDGVF